MTALSSLLILLCALTALGVSDVRAQFYHIATDPDFVCAYPDRDTPFAIILAVGPKDTYPFEPDNQPHTYSFLGGDSGVISYVSDREGSFKGFDTLWGNFHSSSAVPFENYLHFLIDGKHLDSVYVAGILINTFNRDDLVSFDSTLKLGSKVTTYMGIHTQNVLPVSIVSISVTGDTAISLIDSSLHLPFVLQRGLSNEYLPLFQLHIAPLDTTRYVQCKITLITEWGNEWFDTSTYFQGFHYVDPTVGECLKADYITINDVTPFGYTSTKKIEIYNTQPVSILITGVHVDSAWIPFLRFDTSHFPLTVPAHDSSSIFFTLTIPADTMGSHQYGGGSYVYFDIASLDSDGIMCPYSYTTIEIRPFRLSYDTIAVPLFSSEYTPIDFVIGLDFSARAQFVRFVNNGSDDVRILSKDLTEDSIAYFIPYWGYSSDTLLRNSESFTAAIGWNPALEWTFPDSNHLVLHYSDGTKSRQIPILIEFHFGVQQQIPHIVQCTIAPNPATLYSAIHLTGFLRATYRVIDPLGREVIPITQVFGPEYSARLLLSNLSAGLYFIIMEGEDDIGRPFTQSHSIVLLP